MMTIQQFVQAVEKAAKGTYCAAKVEVSSHPTDCGHDQCRRREVTYSAYSEKASWSKDYATPEEAVAFIAAKHSSTPQPDLAALGTAPEATPTEPASAEPFPT